MQVVKFNNEQIVEDEYFSLINGEEEHGNFKKPLVLIKDLRKKYNSCDFEYVFLTGIIRNFKRLILMKPKSIELWAKKIDKCCHDKFYSKTYDNEEKKWKFSQTEFGEDLSKALAYGKLQKKVLKKFYHRNKIKTCNYCNSQYTLTFSKDDKEAVKFQIDHIFPKKKYPYFSISMYNLIPSCASCNLNKGDRDFWTNEYCHPYLQSLGDLFKFTLGRESDNSLYAKCRDIDLDDLDIAISGLSNKKVKAHNEMFDIEGIHSNFKEIAAEIISLGREYPEAKRYELLEKYRDKDGNRLFKSKNSIDRLFLRVYPNKRLTNERPLSKFIRDIARFSDFYD